MVPVLSNSWRSLCLAVVACCVSCQSTGSGGPPPGVLLASVTAVPAPHPMVLAAVSAVDTERLREDLATLVDFGTRHTRSDTESHSRGIGAARRWLHQRFAEIAAEVSAAGGATLEVSSEHHPIAAGRRMPEPIDLVNVVATIPGSDSNRVIVLSGHYDSRTSTDADITGDAPGANDDGSGTVAALEAARCIALALGDRVPRATIRFAAVAGEEQGLYGSRAMAQADRAAGRDVFAMITNDIVGGLGGGNGEANRGTMRLFSEGVPSSELSASVVGSDNDAPSRQLARTIFELGQRYVPSLWVQLVFRQDRYLRGGDHKAFNEQGYAAVRFTDTHEHYDRQHQDVKLVDGRQYGDLLEFVDFENLTDVVRLDVAAMLSLALAPPEPTGVSVDTTGLTNDSRLYWDDPHDPTVVGYRLRLRHSSSPNWEQVVDVGNVHEYTLSGVSKDHWLFGVEAYDQAGLHSVMVYPAPGY